MSESNALVDCRHCGLQHRRRFLCDQAARLLGAIAEHGAKFDVPTVELPEAVYGALGLDTHAGDALLEQIVVQAGVVEVGGVPQPVLVFTGRSADSKPLPRWIYIGSDGEISRVRQLVDDVTGIALRAAGKARRAA